MRGAGCGVWRTEGKGGGWGRVRVQPRGRGAVRVVGGLEDGVRRACAAAVQVCDTKVREFGVRRCGVGCAVQDKEGGREDGVRREDGV